MIIGVTTASIIAVIRTHTILITIIIIVIIIVVTTVKIVQLILSLLYIVVVLQYYESSIIVLQCDSVPPKVHSLLPEVALRRGIGASRPRLLQAFGGAKGLRVLALGL